MIKRYRCKRTGKEVAAVPSKRMHYMMSEDGHFHTVLTEVFEKGYEEITDKEELKVKVTKLPLEFVAGEQILVRCKETHRWFKVKFVRTEGKSFLGNYGSFYTGKQWRVYEYAIPYEGNEHLELEVSNCSSGRWPDDYESPKPEHAFKPFDRVVVRDGRGVWFIEIFSHIVPKNKTSKYYGLKGLWEHCLPYNEKTAKLIGTTDDWEG